MKRFTNAYNVCYVQYMAFLLFVPLIVSVILIAYYRGHDITKDSKSGMLFSCYIQSNHCKL